MSQKSDVQKFEPDFFERTYPSITKDVSIAFSEIVANAWDASATRIDITIPRELNDNIIIEDNGSGMTDDEFRNRWMVISYNRVTHQGEYIEPLPDRGKIKRLAYGRNGVGRHAMVCFNNYYTVETCKDGKRNEYDISAVSDGNSVLSIVDHRVTDCTTTGTKLIVKAVKKLPTVSEIRNALSYKFLFDPEFQIYVNNKLVDYHNLLIPTKKDSIKIGENTAEINIYEVPDGEKVTASTGIAFWIGNLPGLTFARLVGNPSWIVGGYTVADARRKFAKKHIIMVKADFLRADVLNDWSGLQKTELVNNATKAVSAYVKKFRAAYYSDKVSEMKEDVIRQNIEEIETLSISSRHELREFFDIYLSEKPEVDIEELNIIIGALINILNSRNGLSLLNKLSEFDGAELNVLDDVLSEWSVYDIKTVLDEIDGRIKVIHAIEKLCGDKTVNELQVLHPLITQAKWLFGIEYDTLNYTSNSALSTIIKKFFEGKRRTDIDINWKKRPDLVISADFSIGVSSVEDTDENEIVYTDKILIIELKKGASTIGRDEMRQAEEYVDALYFSNSLHAKPQIKAFVVGDKIYSEMSTTNPRLDSGNKYGEIHAYTYTKLVQTAKRRLMNLKEKLNERYGEMNVDDYLQKILKEARQMSLQA